MNDDLLTRLQQAYNQPKVTVPTVDPTVMTRSDVNPQTSQAQPIRKQRSTPYFGFQPFFI